MRPAAAQQALDPRINAHFNVNRTAVRAYVQQLQAAWALPPGAARNMAHSAAEAELLQSLDSRYVHAT